MDRTKAQGSGEAVAARVDFRGLRRLARKVRRARCKCFEVYGSWIFVFRDYAFHNIPGVCCVFVFLTYRYDNVPGSGLIVLKWQWIRHMNGYEQE